MPQLFWQRTPDISYHDVSSSDQELEKESQHFHQNFRQKQSAEVWGVLTVLIFIIAVVEAYLLFASICDCRMENDRGKAPLPQCWFNEPLRKQNHSLKLLVEYRETRFSNEAQFRNLEKINDIEAAWDALILRL
jgi:hypothetical protein